MIPNTKDCQPSTSEDNGLIKNIAEYEIYQIGETSQAATEINNTLWTLKWEYMNPHQDGVSRQLVRSITGSLDVFPIGGSDSKVFDNQMLNDAQNCATAGFIK